MGSGYVHLSGVSCVGSESSITQCGYTIVSSLEISHQQDVGVQCQQGITCIRVSVDTRCKDLTIGRVTIIYYDCTSYIIIMTITVQETVPCLLTCHPYTTFHEMIFILVYTRRINLHYRNQICVFAPTNGLI